MKNNKDHGTIDPANPVSKCWRKKSASTSLPGLLHNSLCGLRLRSMQKWIMRAARLHTSAANCLCHHRNKPLAFDQPRRPAVLEAANFNMPVVRGCRLPSAEITLGKHPQYVLVLVLLVASASIWQHLGSCGVREHLAGSGSTWENL